MKGRTMKRNKSGQFVKGGRASSSSGAKKGKSPKGKSSKKGMAKRSGGLGSARAEYMMKKPAAGDSASTAIKKLQHNQAVLARGVTVLAEEVAVHRRALVGAGLIAARGGA